MLCPFCKNKTKIYNSRSTQRSTQTWRRHRCLACDRTFTTKERVDWNGRIQIDSSEEAAPYSRERLFLSILKACDQLELPPEALTDLTDAIEYELQTQAFFTKESQPATEIIAVVTGVLCRFDPNLALQYINHVYRSKPPLELIRQITEL